MNRITRWLLLVAFLIVVGLWPAAVAPVTLALAGADLVLAAIPGPVLLLSVGVIWLWTRNRPTPTPAKTA
ncbi:hypothetical protein ABZ588_21360 [Streptomyces althioticus]|uniref:hypothetical protein n=1 Tax=Streptomyces althioticus TaxID=83380 RepID=UPI0034020626